MTYSDKFKFISLQIEMQERYLRSHHDLLKELLIDPDDPNTEEPNGLITKDDANREYLAIHQIVDLLRYMRDRELSVSQVKHLVSQYPVTSLFEGGELRKVV